MAPIRASHYRPALLACALVCVGGRACADFTPTSGSAEYTTSGNWTGGAINGRFTSPLTGNLTVTFSQDRVQTGPETGLLFDFDPTASSFTVTAQSFDATPHLLTLNSDIVTGTAFSTPKAVTIGSTANPLNMDLGSVSRTFTVGGTSDLLTVASAISGAAGLGITKAGPGGLTLSVTSTYTGPTIVSGGVLNVSSDANLGTPPPLTQNTTPTVSTPGTLVLQGTTLHVTASFTINVNRGIVIGNASGSGGVGIINVDAGRTLTNAGFINNNTGGSARLIKTGSGQLTLNTQNNQFNGGVSILGGTVRITGDQRLGVAPAAATPGSVVMDGGTLQFGGSTNPLNVNVRRGFALGSVSGTGTGTFDTVTAPTAPDTVATVTIAGVIADNTDGVTTGSGRLVKTGVQALNLTGANTYSGGTTIQAGFLRVNNTTGSGTGTGAVSVTGTGAVASGGTLSGGTTAGTAGIITGNIAVSTPDAAPTTQGGSLAPGTPPQGAAAPGVGILTIGPTSVMTWNPKGTYVFEHDPTVTNPTTPGTSNDTINAPATPAGTLNLTALSPTSQFSIGLYPTSFPTPPPTGQVTYTAGTFTLVNVTGSFGTVNMANGVNNATNISSLFNFAGYFASTPIAAISNNVLYLQFQPVPEPAHVLLACGGVAGLVGWWRKRRPA